VIGAAAPKRPEHQGNIRATSNRAALVQGNMTEIQPGVFRLRVYVAWDANGRTKLRSATIEGK
jgi:hypothetical protein